MNSLFPWVNGSQIPKLSPAEQEEVCRLWQSGMGIKLLSRRFRVGRLLCTKFSQDMVYPMSELLNYD
jgi:hypothetical protein